MSYMIISGRGNLKAAVGNDNAIAACRQACLVGNSALGTIPITCVALGRNTFGPEGSYYVICTEEGNASWKGPASFGRKMRQIDVTQIKGITFGPDDAWAITMKNGHCHAQCQRDSNGPLDAINEHQGSISYVSMTENLGEWIVGFGSNEWKSNGMDDELISYLEGAIACGHGLDSVKLGARSDLWWVKHGGGTRCEYRFSLDTCPDDQVAMWD